MKFSLTNLAFTGWRYVLVALLLLGVGGYYFFGQGKNLGATFTVSSGDFKEQVSVSGTVIAAQNVDLGFAANGRVAGVYAKVGQYVTAGTILAEIENGDLVAILAQAQANLASLREGTRPEEVAVASTAVTSATSALVNAIQNAYTTSDDAVHNKVDTFFTNPRTSPKLSFNIANASLQTVVEHDRAAIEPTLLKWSLLVAKLTNANAAESAVEAQTYLAQVVTLLADANAALNQGSPDQTNSASALTGYATTLAVARANVNTTATTLTANTTALDAAKKNLALKQAGPTTESVAAQEAAVRSAQAMLTKTRVMAPFSGTVTRMDAKVGEIISPTSSQISMQSGGLFQIETYVPEVTIARVAIGNQATTTLDAYSASITFPSVVVAVDPAETVKDGVPTYKTTLAFLKADELIRSGMTANVSIETGILTDAIVIPAGAVGTKGKESYVTVVENNTAISRTVTLGASPALGQAHILSGLSAGDVILLTPAP